MKLLKNKLIVINLLIYIISLFFNAFTVIEAKEIRNYSSFELLLVGGISFLGGGILECFIWSANIWFFAAITCSFFKKFVASIIMGIISLSISGSFMFWKTVLVSESGREANIYSLETGYFLWLTSILFLIFSSIYLRIKKFEFEPINRNGL